MSLAILVIPLASRSRRSASISCEAGRKNKLDTITTVSKQYYIVVQHKLLIFGGWISFLNRLPEAAQAAGRFVR